MYAYHHILHKFEQWVEFYVVDAKPLPSGRSVVYLTVLIDPGMFPHLWRPMFHQLMECMDQISLHEIASDLAAPVDAERPVSFSVLVLPSKAVFQ